MRRRGINIWQTLTHDSIKSENKIYVIMLLILPLDFFFFNCRPSSTSLFRAAAWALLALAATASWLSLSPIWGLKPEAAVASEVESEERERKVATATEDKFIFKAVIDQSKVLFLFSSKMKNYDNQAASKYRECSIGRELCWSDRYLKCSIVVENFIGRTQAKPEEI